MAQYLTYLYYMERYGEGAASGFYQSLEGRWQQVNGDDIPIGLPVAEYTPMEYGAIVYGRGPIFLAMLEDEIGEAAFDTFLETLFSEYRFGIATTESVKEVAEAACSCDLDSLWEEWVYGDG
jgi:aminopeptidase N